MMFAHTDLSQGNTQPPARFSSVLQIDNKVIAGTYGQGIYLRDGDVQWYSMSKGLPESVVVHRLCMVNDVLFASTNQGLFYRLKETWSETDITFPCYCLIRHHHTLMAATFYGLYVFSQNRWVSLAYAHLPVYDLLPTSQFVFLSHEKGISMYDQLTDEWEDFSFASGILSMGVFEQHLLGVTNRGAMMIGNKQGGFQRLVMPNMFIYSLVQYKSDVFVCTNKGVYRMSRLKGQLTLKSVFLGNSVTDLCFSPGKMVLATLNQGVMEIPYE